MARYDQDHQKVHADQGKHVQSGKKHRSSKVMSAGFLSAVLLVAVIMFAVCFAAGMTLGPNLPI